MGFNSGFKGLSTGKVSSVSYSALHSGPNHQMGYRTNTNPQKQEERISTRGFDLTVSEMKWQSHNIDH